jgi:magnesium transporter
MGGLCAAGGASFVEPEGIVHRAACLRGEAVDLSVASRLSGSVTRDAGREKTDMLSLHTGAIPPEPGGARHPRPEVLWFDLLDATDAEVSEVEQATGLHVPAREELSEIESSSRLRVVGEALYLSTPLVYRMDATRAPGEKPVGTTPVGFVLTRDFLITVRYAKLTAFTMFAERMASEPAVDGPTAFVGLAEAIVDRMADVLETVGAELDQISTRIFGSQLHEVSRMRRPKSEDADLRAILRRIGRAGDLASRIRDGLLGIGRIVPFVTNTRPAWFTPDLVHRLETQRQDMASIGDYDAHLINKVQFLLDATMGLIGIEQNNVFKVLTVVSIIGIPPTLVAGIYGMNFKNIPEYDWPYGYQYGLGVLVLSAVIPWVWIKLRGWL